MKEELQIKALAELDGWDKEPTPNTSNAWGVIGKKPVWNYRYQLPRYLTSYDAIIPLIQKQPLDVIADVMVRVSLHNTTPAQLAEALLRATGKWIAEK